MKFNLLETFTILLMGLPIVATSQMIQSPNVYPTHSLGFSQGIISNNFLFVSGQVGWDKGRKLTGTGTFDDQAQQTFKNIEAVLKEANLPMDKVVYMRIFVTEMTDENKRTITALLHKYFSNEYKPATSLIGVNAFARKELLIEIEAIAQL